MKRFSKLLLGICFVAGVSACGKSLAPLQSVGSTKALNVTLPIGIKSAAFDPDAGVVYIVTATNEAPGSRITLSALTVSTGAVETTEIAGPMLRARFRQPVAALGPPGQVLIGLGRDLVVFTSASRKSTVFTLPDNLGRASSDEGGISAVARVGDRIDVAIGGSYELLELQSAKWSKRTDLSVFGWDGSSIVALSDGSLLINGKRTVAGGTNENAVASLANAGTAGALRQGLWSCRAAGTSTPVCVTERSTVDRYDGSSEMSVPSNVNLLRLKALVLSAADPMGGLWIWQAGRDGASVVRIDTNTKSAASASFPIERVASGSQDLGSHIMLSPGPVVGSSSESGPQIDPGVDAIVPLSGDTAYVITDSGVGPEGQRSIYSAVYLVTIPS